MKRIIGKKLGMSSVFSASGELVATTVIEVQPNLIMEIKKPEKHNYSSVVVGYQDVKESRLTKPVKGQFTKKKLPLKKTIVELRDLDIGDKKEGEFLSISDVFQIGNFVDVQGYTRGHGFTGAIKLWNFATGPKSHGAGYPHRFQGSIETGRGGAAAQKVWKGKKMSGRYGNEKVTITNLEILFIDAAKNFLFIKGAIPGRKNQIVFIKTTSRKNKTKTEPFQVLINEKN